MLGSFAAKTISIRDDKPVTPSVVNDIDDGLVCAYNNLTCEHRRGDAIGQVVGDSLGEFLSFGLLGCVELEELVNTPIQICSGINSRQILKHGFILV